MNFLLIVAGNVDNLSMHLNISAESSVNCLLKCKKKNQREKKKKKKMKETTWRHLHQCKICLSFLYVQLRENDWYPVEKKMVFK